MEAQTVLASIQEIAAEFAGDRAERQQRRHLEDADFKRLADAGFLLTGVPKEQGGFWENAQRSTRLTCELLRTLAAGDPSVALVASMHPAVLAFWLATPQTDAEHQAAWEVQRETVFGSARDGAWWGTITSEPGSGGDITRSNSNARRDGDGYRLTGQKHFGSGLGNASYMMTTAVPEGETDPDWFYLDVRGVPWDGSTGMTLVAPWDGHGMIATQSHAVQFNDFPATRFGWPRNMMTVADPASPIVGSYFTSVIVGIVETALATASQQLARKAASLRPFEQVEWAKAEVEGWLIQQAFEGMLRAVEAGPGAGRSVLMGKTAVAELAASVTNRICKVVGGGTYGRQSPYGNWFEDVRALGFLRPPWGVAYDRLIGSAWPNPA